MTGKTNNKDLFVPQTILMVQGKAQTIPIQKLKITKSEASHQCQAKEGSTEKVETGHLY